MNVQLFNDDCLNVLQTLPKVDAVITDPPYGMDYDTDSTRFTMNENGHGKSSTRNYPKVAGDAQPFDPSPWLTFPRVVLFGSNHFAARLPIGTTLVWLKKHDSNYGTFLSDAEVAWMKGGHGVYAHRDTSLLGETNKRVHPTQKPVGLMKWVLQRAGVEKGMTVFDPYMGSGPLGIACVQLGIDYIGAEIYAPYFAIAQRRIEAAQAQGRLSFEVSP